MQKLGQACGFKITVKLRASIAKPFVSARPGAPGAPVAVARPGRATAARAGAPRVAARAVAVPPRCAWRGTMPRAALVRARRGAAAGRRWRRAESSFGGTVKHE